MTPEEVALGLMRIVATIERVALDGDTRGGQRLADRKWVLETYAECLNAVKADPQIAIRHFREAE